ncbi:RNA polymerase factor sigma-54 [Gluconacetobacter diazotrophicus]|uniref:RNA polymerase sigma-54 factor n=2 Tax=Gluconacetobacter diazotrophicus TaxID=33996 RepID=A9HKN2_GLUDA|nr:RNA polymerase factor sigma-54 [Gluconacetobacter diazotrophicus]MBB2154945.1 RNA polymerase factor sigma-54 [Gluconacetobacter diazotrophicus]CAP56062.1 putative RNA polymerase sigma-54 factor 1 [Gluconacetobacter diazotrophicus PA1 5]
MTIGPRLALRQAQTLVMTPQLRQAIHLLQLSNLDACSFIEQELERNPLLERANLAGLEELRPKVVAHGARHDPRLERVPDQDWAATAGTLPGPAPSLHERLAQQVRLSWRDAGDRLVGAYLITLLDADGRLVPPTAVIAQSLGTTFDHVERVRQTMMQFEPTGLFAHDLGECLAAQLRERDRLDPAMAVLLRHLDLLARRDLRRLQGLCGVDAEDLADMIAEVRTLSPRPARDFGDPAACSVIPDVLLQPAPDGDWMLELNPETMPSVVVNSALSTRVALRARREDRPFLNERLASANWLVRALQQRADTIIRVATAIMRRQRGFLDHGIGHLRPLVLRDIAETVGLHESTVSRVTANKYIATPRGLFELKYFFTTAIPGRAGGADHSAEAIRHRIKTLISQESDRKILSDDAIVTRLRKEGIDISRRTVAKYRDALRIPNSTQRKRDKALIGLKPEA